MKLLGQIFGAFNLGVSPEETKELSKFNKTKIEKMFTLVGGKNQFIDFVSENVSSECYYTIVLLRVWVLWPERAILQL